MNIDKGDIYMDAWDTPRFLKHLQGGDLIPVALEDMNKDQRDRFDAGEQPVVKQKDHTSLLAQQRDAARKDRIRKQVDAYDKRKAQEQTRIAKNRTKQKQASKARKRNRK